jgi:hypothetical protein
MALGATLSARKFVLCGSGFQPRLNRDKMQLSQKKEINFLGRAVGLLKASRCAKLNYLSL